jgi:hypothetical protein
VGGSHAYADTATGIAFALTKNRLTADFSAAEEIAGIGAKAVASSAGQVCPLPSCRSWSEH